MDGVRSAEEFFIHVSLEDGRCVAETRRLHFDEQRSVSRVRSVHLLCEETDPRELRLPARKSAAPFLHFE